MSDDFLLLPNDRDTLLSIKNCAHFVSEIDEVARIVEQLPGGDWVRERVVAELPQLEVRRKKFERVLETLRELYPSGTTTGIEPEIAFLHARISYIKRLRSHRGPKFNRKAYYSVAFLENVFKRHLNGFGGHTNSSGDFATALEIVYRSADIQASPGRMAKQLNKPVPHLAHPFDAASLWQLPPKLIS